jgi:hypothetical protein
LLRDRRENKKSHLNTITSHHKKKKTVMSCREKKKMARKNLWMKISLTSVKAVSLIASIHHHLFLKNRDLTTSHLQKRNKSHHLRMNGSVHTVHTHLVLSWNGKKNWNGSSI